MSDELNQLRAQLDELQAERQITRGLYAFARGMDARDWLLVRSLLLDDAVGEFGRGKEMGADRIVASIREFLDVCGPTQHLLGNIEIDVDINGGTAQSHSYVSDMHLGAGDRSALTFSTLGEYHDDWVCGDDGWKIKRRVKDSRAVLGSFDVFTSD